MPLPIWTPLVGAGLVCLGGWYLYDALRAAWAALATWAARRFRWAASWPFSAGRPQPLPVVARWVAAGTFWGWLGVGAMTL